MIFKGNLAPFLKVKYSELFVERSSYPVSYVEFTTYVCTFSRNLLFSIIVVAVFLQFHADLLV